jgi:hypothetical protein
MTPVDAIGNRKMTSQLTRHETLAPAASEAGFHFPAFF